MIGTTLRFRLFGFPAGGCFRGVRRGFLKGCPGFTKANCIESTGFGVFFVLQVFSHTLPMKQQGGAPQSQAAWPPNRGKPHMRHVENFVVRQWFEGFQPNQ